MTKLRIAINGFGRIGRITARMLLQRNDVELVAVNDLTDTHTLAHLFKYDSIHGVYQGEVSHDGESLHIDGHTVKGFSEEDPSALPWGKLGIDVVVESTGIFLTREKASGHLKAGAKKVVLSAPAKGEGIKTVVLGVNDDQLDGTEDIISNASCTTNCAAPMVQVIHELCDIESGYITTVHAYTSDQRLHDAPHRDLRRSRAAAVSMIPTTTGAAKAITKIFPKLDGRLGGAGIRVPVADGSLTDITCHVNRTVSAKAINARFKELAEGKWKGIVRYTEDPIVSIDIVGDPNSCIIDGLLTSVIGSSVKVMGWYDNEYGFSARLVDLVVMLGKRRA